MVARNVRRALEALEGLPEGQPLAEPDLEPARRENLTSAAASSRANGSPSSRAQIRSIVTDPPARWSGRIGPFGPGNEHSAASGGGKGGTSILCSPRIRSGSRLVDRTSMPCAPERRSTTTSPASSKCSKLSSTRSSSRSDRAVTRVRSKGSPATAVTPSTERVRTPSATGFESVPVARSTIRRDSE